MSYVSEGDSSLESRWSTSEDDHYCPAGTACRHASIRFSSSEPSSSPVYSRAKHSDWPDDNRFRYSERWYSDDCEMDPYNQDIASSDIIYVLEDGCFVFNSSYIAGKQLWWFHSSRADGRCEKHQSCIDTANPSYLDVAPTQPPTRREIEGFSSVHAYVEQLQAECINLRWRLEAVEYSSEHKINQLYNEHEDLSQSHAALQHDHRNMTQKHDRLIDVAILMCAELKTHAKCIIDLYNWTPRITRVQKDVGISYRSPSATPVHEIHLSDMEPNSQPTTHDSEHLHLVSPASPAFTPHVPITEPPNTLENPKVFLKLRGLRPTGPFDAGYGGDGEAQSHPEAYISPPSSAPAGTTGTKDVESAASGRDGHGDDVAASGDGKRWSSARVRKPSSKRKAEIYCGAPLKRSRPCS